MEIEKSSPPMGVAAGAPAQTEGNVAMVVDDAKPATEVAAEGVLPSKIHIYESCPPDKTNLRILLISAQRTDFLVDPKETVEQFCQIVYNQWPQEWRNDKTITSPASTANIKLLHRGKFADKATTLESNGFNLGLTTIVHILVKNELSAGADSTTKKGSKEEVQGASCRCIIL